MRVVYEASNLIDGQLVKGLLENHGIPAFLSGEYLTGALGELPIGGLVRVLVREDREHEARDLIAATVSTGT